MTTHSRYIHNNLDKTEEMKYRNLSLLLRKVRAQIKKIENPKHRKVFYYKHFLNRQVSDISMLTGYNTRYIKKLLNRYKMRDSDIYELAKQIPIEQAEEEFRKLFDKGPLK